ncbi:MAG: DHHA1 domain-containing protein, partial [Candidatus Thermoplasmatota archaeon]
KLQEGVTRITFSFGEEALKRDYREERAVLRAVEALDTNKKDLPKKIRRLQDKLKDMEEKIEQLESEKIEQELEEFEKFERENFELLVQTLSTEDTETLSHKAKDEVGEDEAMVIINEREKLSVVVGVGKDVEEINANDLIQTISKKFGGGGGGTSDFAQGGGFDTTAGDLKDFLIKFTE